MNDTTIKPISSVQPSDNSALVRAAQAQSDAAAQSRAAPKVERESEPKADAVQTANSLANVSIHFRVDDKTNDVTVFLVDRKSRKVLRSIPASELQKLQIGDLLKLTM